MEPRVVARFLATKHSWRGRYMRIFVVAEDGLYTLNPQTFDTTNVWLWDGDVVDAGAVLGSGSDFFLRLTHDPDGMLRIPFGTHRKLWSCEHRAKLLTALQCARAAAAAAARPARAPPADVARFAGARVEFVAPDGTPMWMAVTLVATGTALQLRDPGASDSLLEEVPYASVRALGSIRDLPALLRRVLSALPPLGLILSLGEGLPFSPGTATASPSLRFSGTPPALMSAWATARAADDASYRPTRFRCDAYRQTAAGPRAVALLVTDNELIERETGGSAVRASWPLSELAAALRPPDSPTALSLVLRCAEVLTFVTGERDAFIAALLDAAAAAGFVTAAVHEAGADELRAARLLPWSAATPDAEGMPPSSELQAKLLNLVANASATGRWR
ncbi:hypothetical protein T492DRAFT_901175 [Pavlovales sp. CCMP2436]|nr:hypothetical protein T492DRAFT_901175 [Pavlovales sp. CCMP2436]